VTGDEEVDLGAVVVGVVVVGVVVGVVVVGSVASVEPDEDAVEEGAVVVGVVVVGVVVVAGAPVVDVVGSAPADEEWVTVSEATRTPRPTAPAAAATPMAAVARLTRLVALSRSSAAYPAEESVVRGGRAMMVLSFRVGEREVEPRSTCVVVPIRQP
jgi:hypothetical protein